MKKVQIYTVFKDTECEFIGNKKEIAEHFGINYQTFRDRTNKMGLSLEDAINYQTQKGKTPKIYTVFKGTDKEFTGNLIELSKHFNFDKDHLRKLIKKFDNKSLDEIIYYYLKNQKSKLIVFEGTDKEFEGNKKEIAEHFNKNYSKLIYRINKNGYSLEEALEIPSKNIKDYIAYKDYKGPIRQLCIQLNKNYIEVYNKIKNNYTFEYAIESTNTPYI